ncbi:hypothetical protein G3545_21970 [Starkeya sp. ORNL1]|uniref:hypothetical protein n=1 Tax=Starkeya sp. ORNL1 TaxID=2709380 RepID=UPI00146298EC|nr:hypothetical protein [Starkeya sp. ORNL1]QJP16073.1 hypothetical protein G3545_21970 [Starkeya sp. ORNL1]
MPWVRMHPFIANWPGGGGPPVFEITSDGNGEAVVELAWDPQALANPGSYPDPDGLRYYSTDVAFSASVVRDRGGAMSVNVPSQRITLQANRASFAIPQALWDGYVEESLKSLNSPPTTTFSRNIYYRVRVTPPGSATAEVWPSDAVLGAQNATAPPPASGVLRSSASGAPHIGILPISASAASRVVPDTAAVQAMGGPPFVPNLWSTVLTAIWNGLPENDPSRMSLATVFAHPVFAGATTAIRADILKLWLFGGKSRTQIPRLLSRQVVTGSNVLTPVIAKRALKGGKTLVPLLLDLSVINVHPDIGIRTREDIIDDVVREILDPNGQVNQGGAGTCVPTSIQTMLITINPAEYVRLQIGWLSTAGRAELANGATADVPPGIFQIARYVGPTGSPTNVSFLFRTYAEMAFQGAILKVGQGSAFPAHDGSEASTQAIFTHVYKGGLGSTQTQTALAAIFNTPFKLSGIAWPTTLPNFAMLQQSLRIGLVADLAAKQQQILFAIYWGVPPQTPVPPMVVPANFFGSHAVLAMRHEGGRMFYKNPQYAGSTPVPGTVNGGNGTNPPRRYEDITGSLESMTDGDLDLWMYWYLTPDTALI